MKLKALKPRMYNVMLHAHTVSGIVISFALYVIFFAGAVSLFMNEMYRWENPDARFENVDPAKVDYDKILLSVKNNVKDFDINGQVLLNLPTKSNPFVLVNSTINTPNGRGERFSTYVNPITYEVMQPKEPKTHMARTLYELHYFGQIPIVGIFLAGLVSFFFTFAIITGVLVHWKNIVNKFYGFKVKGKWKQIWTDGHISLGFIALPFQLVYAVTGALLCLSIFLLAPSIFLIFKGDASKVFKAVRPDMAYKQDPKAKTLDSYTSLNSIYKKVKIAIPNSDITSLYTNNYTKEDGIISATTDDRIGITGEGLLIYRGKDGKLLEHIDPRNKTYASSAFSVLVKLHYAKYGGFFLKIIYFILSMITCYIIISGVMIWRTARDNARYTDRQRKFHHRVTKLYLSITLSMFPALAVIFLANISIPMDLHNRATLVNIAFFVGWLSLAVWGLFCKDYAHMNRRYIVSGSILGLLIPVANGVFTGDWIWKTLSYTQVYVYMVDMTWLFIGVFGLLIYKNYLRKKSLSNK